MTNATAANKVTALLLASHPGPTVVVTVVATVLGASLGYPPGRLAVLALAILLGQLSIGWSNDWLDAARDAQVERADKPAARGAIGVVTVRTAAFVALVAAVLVTLVLGPLAAIAHVVAIAGGWAYNLGLKATAVSFLPFAVSFGILPAIVTLGLEPPRLAAAWVVAAGALLGVAAHVTNVLPDLADDDRTGIRGLPHRMGAVPSGLLAFACLAAASVLIAFGPGWPPRIPLLIGLAIGIVIAVTGVVLLLRRSPTRLLMQLIMGCAVVDVVMLAFAGQSTAV
ncbi:UbiA family prenyltransferase [Leifsonia sp. Le1]|uniref:UbiA family prenyltransferase n=1 Tax=Leifsonia sp. Le1 TaxID=3404918 RepID=UPI003EBB8BD6